jgi:hypothetical protein
MKDNERKLAIVRGAVVVGLVLFLGFRYYSDAVGTRTALIDDLSSKLRAKKLQVAETVKATQKVNEYEARSLPPDPALARSLYQHWLLTKVQEAGLRDQVVTPTGQRPVGDVFVQQTFTVNGKGRYEQIVKVLDDIYRIDLLHRVSRLSIKPIKDSKELDMSLTLDAVSVRTAPEATTLRIQPSQRLKLDSVEKYQLAIVGRNIFAPPYDPPRISGLGMQKGTTNRWVDIVAKASDPDPLDSVKLELTKSPSRDAKLDSSGKLLWTPKKAGDYEFEIAALDDNFPPRVSTEKLIVTVTDAPKPPPPPPPGPKEEPKLAFDNAKHTVLTAILEVDGEGEIWLFVRPTATLLKLHQGDPIEIGSIKGKIEEIGDNEFVFLSSAKETKGKHLRVTRGEFLEQAVQVSVATGAEVPEESAPESKPEGTTKSSDSASADDKPADVKPSAEKPAEEKPVTADADDSESDDGKSQPAKQDSEPGSLESE